MRYLAFISYTHRPLDKAVAKGLHRLLENYRPPRALVKGAKHPTRVFRDREELGVSSDLTASIRDALDQSEYLIVVCTPDTPCSKWVHQEIEYFQRHHDPKRVLTVLAAGEPEEAFPWPLRHPYPDAPEREISPLAADVRAENKWATLFKLWQEYLRLCAAILNVPYDDLAQRQHKRRMWRLIGIIVALLLVVGTLIYFSTQLSFKNGALESANQTLEAQRNALEDANQSLEVQRNALEEANETLEAQRNALEEANQTLEAQKLDLQRNESRLLAESARQALESGNYIKALTEAAAALPQDETDTRPYCAPAEAVLMTILAPDGQGDEKELVTTTVMEQETDILFFRVSADEKRCYTIDVYGSVRCLDSLTGQELWRNSLPFAGSDYYPYSTSLLLAEKRNQLFVAGRFEDAYSTDNDQMSIAALDAETGKTLWLHPLQAERVNLILSEDEARLACLIAISENRKSDYQWLFLASDTGKLEMNFALSSVEGLSDFELYLDMYDSVDGAFAEDDSSMFSGVVYVLNADKTKTRIFYSIDLHTQEVKIVYADLRQEVKIMLSMHYVKEKHSLIAVSDGLDDLIAAELTCIDTDSGELKWTAETPAIDSRTYGLAGPDWDWHTACVLYDDENDVILIGRRRNAYAYDIQTGVCLCEDVWMDDGDSLFHDDIKAMFALNEDNLYGFILANGSICQGSIDNQKTLIYQDSGIALGSVTEAEVVSSRGNNVQGGAISSVAYLSGKDERRKLCFSYLTSIDIPWSCTDLGEFYAMLPVSPDCSTWVDDETVYIALYMPQMNAIECALVSINTHTLESVVHVFTVDRYLVNYLDGDYPTLIPTQEDKGVLILTGEGDLLYFDEETGRCEPLIELTNSQEGRDGDLRMCVQRRSEDGAAVAVICDSEDLCISLNGASFERVPLSEGMIWQRHVNDIERSLLAAGGNGYVLMSSFGASDQDDAIDEFALYDTAQSKWRFVPDIARGSANRSIALANEISAFVVADADQCLRVYSIDSGECMMTSGLPVSLNSIKRMGFSQDDRFVYIQTDWGSCRLLIYDLRSGDLVYTLYYPTFSSEDVIDVISDSKNDRLYILMNDYEFTESVAWCIDTRSWTQLAMDYVVPAAWSRDLAEERFGTVEGMSVLHSDNSSDTMPIAFVPETGVIVGMTSDFSLILQSMPTTFELVETAKQLAGTTD